MTTVFFKGLGLIGSSLAQAVRLAHPTVKILASDPQVGTTTYALDHGVIDQATTGFDQVEQADFIVLASPVSQIESDLKALAKLTLKPGVIITDVGSTKTTVIKAAQPLLAKGVSFVGGHPMAGSHKSGVQAGRPDLFENAFYFQVPNDHPEAAKQIQDLFSGTHVKWLTVTPPEHDQIVSQISHLPHIIAAALVNQTNRRFKDQPLGMRLAAGGFKSVTRIAAADPTMWTAILAANGPIIRQQLAGYVDQLQRIDQAIGDGDQTAIHQFFNRAKVSREKLNQPVRAPFYDLFLNLPDEVGAVAKVTGLLADHDLSLINLQLLEVRDEIDGILQLTFRTEAEVKAAAAVLAPHYEIIDRGD